MDIRRLVPATGMAVLSGLLLCLLGFLGSLVVVMGRGVTQRIPGLIDYVTNSQTFSVAPDGLIWLTFAILTIVSFPVAWKLAGRSIRMRR